MAYDLPPLTALRAFEAVARLTSFKAAASELFVTSTAISHQIRVLEDYLGLRLLERSPRGVALTPDGYGLYDAANIGFAEIGREVKKIRRGKVQRTLTLSSSAAFLSHWLVPRLGELRELQPNLDLRLHASNAPIQLRAGEIDLAIRYGEGPYSGVDATVLVRDTFAPVCSPRLGIRNLQDLGRATLIHVDGRSRPKPLLDWAHWCGLANVEGVDAGSGLRLPDSLLATQAAIAGQGVAILSLVLIADALKSGLLVQPFGLIMPSDSYHFLSAPDLGTRQDVADLQTWFLTSLASEAVK